MKNWIMRAKLLKAEVIALYFAYKDPRVSWYAKGLIFIIVGYAFSPVDLIPDFIPLIGYLDDLILIPLAISVVIKMIPSYVMEEAREKAAKQVAKIKPKLWLAISLVIAVWIAIIVGLFILLSNLFHVKQWR